MQATQPLALHVRVFRGQAEVTKETAVTVFPVGVRINGQPAPLVAGNERRLPLVAGQYDLIIMDCSMPEMDGYQATGEIRRIEQEGGLPHIPIVALTANALREDREKCLAVGMDGYLSKPVTQEQLRTVLAEFLSPQKALLTTPPSTRNAAPVVAEESGLAT